MLKIRPWIHEGRNRHKIQFGVSIMVRSQDKYWDRFRDIFMVIASIAISIIS